MKPEGKKLKRKIPKAGAAPQQRPYSVSYSDTKMMMMTPETKPHKSSLPFHLFGSSKPSAPQRPALPPPANSGDGKWLEDFRKNGYVYRDGRRNSRLSENERVLERPVSMMAPEFAHLAAVSTPPLESTTTITIGPPPTKGGPPQMTRRYAKTPVSHIGQLETHPLLRTQGTSHDVPTIESIAESYRALLESRASSINEAHPAEHHDGLFNPQDPTFVPPPLEPVTELPEPLPARGSPRSDDGTLVEEDAMDSNNTNKHSHVSSTLSSPTRSSYETALDRRATVGSLRSPELQTCLTLLTRELSLAAAATSRQSAQPGADTTAALQIWVMIEAYERLRDQVLGSHERGVRDGPLRAMFDTWLTALRSVHDGMVGSDGDRSESNYGD